MSKAKWPSHWQFAGQVDHPRDYKLGDRVPAGIPDDGSECRNCRSYLGIMFSFVFSRFGSTRGFKDGAGGYHDRITTTETAPCPVCSFDDAVELVRTRSGLVGMELEGKLASELRLSDHAAKPDQGDAWRVARKLLKEAPAPKTTVLFFGRNGTGKTHILVCLVNEVLACSSQAIYVTAEQILSRLRATYDTEKRSETTEAVRALYESVPGLAIDEFDKISWTSWSGEQLYAVIEARYRAGRATWFASNPPPSELSEAHPCSRSIVSRIEAGFTVAMIGEDLRQYSAPYANH